MQIAVDVTKKNIPAFQPKPVKLQPIRVAHVTNSLQVDDALRNRLNARNGNAWLLLFLIGNQAIAYFNEHVTKWDGDD